MTTAVSRRPRAAQAAQAPRATHAPQGPVVTPGLEVTPSPQNQSAGANDEVVFIASRSTVCGECQKPLAPGTLFQLEAQQPLCLQCALLDKLEFLPSGDVALTRRAVKHSRRHAVVLRWSSSRKRYERRGTLVVPEAIALAQAECQADAARRAAQREKAAARRAVEEREYIAAFTAAVRAQFPGCPLSEARVIAEHACEKYSGRVGRTAAAKELDAEKVRLAVIAHVRHLHTDYDRIIERTRDKRGSRGRVRDKVSAVLFAWEHGGGSST